MHQQQTKTEIRRKVKFNTIIALRTSAALILFENEILKLEYQLSLLHIHACIAYMRMYRNTKYNIIACIARTEINGLELKCTHIHMYNVNVLWHSIPFWIYLQRKRERPLSSYCL